MVWKEGTKIILTHDLILKEIKEGQIKIDPFNEENVGPASIDLSLGENIRIFTNHKSIIEVGMDTDYKDFTEVVEMDHKGYILKPHELILGITQESITLPEDIAGWLGSRSRYARLGLMSHITAPFIAPGASGRQVLEIFNAGPSNLKLLPGIKICHLVLEKCEGRAKYQGIFINQEIE
ncbi:MAG: dCTP deaminase [Promethearchaeota archaeon]